MHDQFFKQLMITNNVQRDLNAWMMLCVFVVSMLAPVEAWAENKSPSSSSSSSPSPSPSQSNSQSQNNPRLAAHEGNPEAQFKLALAYSEQQSNYPLAAYWYTQAARQDMANAQYNLGHFYLQGIGVEQDIAKTIQWWQQSAHQNYPPAQHNIGTAYFEGIGVEKNSQLAQQWFKRCAALGSDTCVKSLAIIKEHIAEPEFEQLSQTKETALEPSQFLVIKPAEQNIDNTTTISSTDNPTSTVITANSISAKIDIPVHIQANSKSAIIDRLTNINDFKVLANKPDNKNPAWQAVELNKAVAIWCYKQFVSINGQTATLTGDKVRARTEPSTQTGKVVKELAKGTELRVLQENSKWVQLALTNHIAWIPSSEAQQAIAQNQTSNINAAQNTSTTKNDKAQDKPVETTEPSIKIKTPKKLIFQYSFIDQRSDDDWLFKSDPEQFTLLLNSFDNNKQLTEFTKQAALTNNNDVHLLLAKRHNIEWKYALYGNFNDKQAAIETAKNKGFNDVYVERIGDIQEHRCSAWKTTIPSPKKLPTYCLKKTAFNS